METTVIRIIDASSSRYGPKKYINLERHLQERLRTLGGVIRVTPSKIELEPLATEAHVKRIRQCLIDNGVKAPQIRVTYGSGGAEDAYKRLIGSIEGFERIDLGADTAEEDHNLEQYFIQTAAFKNVLGGKRTLVIGPKGSGKTAILQGLLSSVDTNYSVLITPEKYAKALLKDVLQEEATVGSDVHAFSVAWTYTIMIEVFKQVLAERRGLRTGSLARIHDYMRDHYADVDLDLLSRFVAFWKRVEGIKVGTFEISIKTRKLESMYRLEDILRLLPALQTVTKGKPIFVLIDELDQGWDNSEITNTFLRSLLLTALKLQSFKSGIQVVAFLRTEIFDILARDFDQLDKLREKTETLRWNRRGLAGVLASRLCYSLGLDSFNTAKLDSEVAATALFPEGGLGSSDDGFEYILSRTSLRPREMLQFTRLAVEEARSMGLSTISSRVLEKSEEVFSKWKVGHLCSEYLHIYPKLNVILALFRHSPAILTYAVAADKLLSFLCSAKDGPDAPNWALVDDDHELVRVLFEVGFLGFRDEAFVSTNPSTLEQLFDVFVFSFMRADAQVRRGADLLIHPGYWKNLEVVPLL